MALRADREVVLLAAVALLARGTALTFGVFSFEAIGYVMAGVLLAAFALRAGDGAAGKGGWAGAVAVCAVTTFAYAPLLHVAVETDLAALLLVSAVLAVLARRFVSVAAAVVVASAVAAMLVVAWRWGSVDIDVFRSLQNASAAVLHGANPYSTTFAANVVVGPSPHFVERTIHFQYLPGVAFLAAAVRPLGDVRLMSLLASLLTIAFAVALARQPRSAGVSQWRVLLLCLALPLTVPMVHNAWVDVYSVAGFAGWITLRRGHSRWALVCLALSLTIKPTILIALVPAFAWSRRARREILGAGVMAAIVILPFALLTGPAAFYQDVIGVQASLGFRVDGLTVTSALYALGGQLPAVWFAFAVGALVTLFALRRRPRDLSDVLIAGALLSATAFMVSKWAFLNYYYLPVWLLVLALAARGIAFDAEADVALPMLALAPVRRMGMASR